MTSKTVAKLAEDIGIPSDELLKQMGEAGLPHSDLASDVTEDQRQTLLAYLTTRNGAEESGQRKTLTLKRKSTGTVKARTSGAGARTRAVPVERRRTRTYAPRDATASGVVEVARSDDFQRVSDEEARRRAAAEAETERKRLEEESRRIAEQARKQAEEEQKAREQKAKQSPEEQQTEAGRKQWEADTAAATVSDDKSRRSRRDRSEEDDDYKASQSKPKRAPRSTRKDKRIDLSEAFDDAGEDLEAETEEAAPLSPVRPIRETRRHVFERPTREIVYEVELGESILVSNLAQKMSAKASDVIKNLMNLGVTAGINESIDQETAILLIEEMGHKVKLVSEDALETEVEKSLVYKDDPLPRAPVVTVMGHVDHGKTSLLDYIRSTTVAAKESGGITQHIGAYRVSTDQGDVCFIDTPGHAAFTAMRARGASCTDLVILVVAADDGVMPQTEEAVQHARAANVPLIVAMNKMDKEGTDTEKIKSELAARDVLPEDWGGDTQFVPVSALTGEGVDQLLEAVQLQAELLELKAAVEGPAQGVVIESRVDKGRGSVTTLLVQKGTLKRGDALVVGHSYGRARALEDEKGKTVKTAGPSVPVSLMGVDGTPSAGDRFTVVRDEKKAREVADFRREKASRERRENPVVTLDSLLDSFGSRQKKVLNIVLKTDVRGSLEAISSALAEVGNEEVAANIVASGVGGITESDVNMAITAEAVVFGFNVRADNAAKRLVDAEGVDLRYYRIIYELVDDVTAVLSGLLAPEVREEVVGIAEVRDVFQSRKFGQIAGCMVIEGTVSKQKKIRVLRDSVVIYEGSLESLRHFKDEVAEIRSGTECGIGVKNYNDVRGGDLIEVFETREVTRQL